ncbi:hypothetical protein HBB16_08130 [Pseudonocardia sp. MCCB 268]|nr:hypothetical protein [Pseudonocardia cytotoxica]
MGTGAVRQPPVVDAPVHQQVPPRTSACCTCAARCCGCWSRSPGALWWAHRRRRTAARPRPDGAKGNGRSRWCRADVLPSCSCFALVQQAPRPVGGLMNWPRSPGSRGLPTPSSSRCRTAGRSRPVRRGSRASCGGGRRGPARAARPGVAHRRRRHRHAHHRLGPCAMGTPCRACSCSHR